MKKILLGSLLVVLLTGCNDTINDEKESTLKEPETEAYVTEVSESNDEISYADLLVDSSQSKRKKENESFDNDPLKTENDIDSLIDGGVVSDVKFEDVVSKSEHNAMNNKFPNVNVGSAGTVIVTNNYGQSNNENKYLHLIEKYCEGIFQELPSHVEYIYNTNNKYLYAVNIKDRTYDVEIHPDLQMIMFQNINNTNDTLIFNL